MVKWPGKIPPRQSNALVSIHDFFPTLAAIFGADPATDRPYDGGGQSAFLLGRQAGSNREHLISFVENEVAIVPVASRP